MKGISGKPTWESNLAVVWGQMSTGGGHTTLTEAMAAIGIPTMTKKSLKQLVSGGGNFLKSQ